MKDCADSSFEYNKYPEDFYRGISDSSAVDEFGYVQMGAFQFSNYDALGRNGDGFLELSINWNDDDGALAKLLTQKKEGQDIPQFNVGYCTIQTKDLQKIFRVYIRDRKFNYERRPIEKNEAEGIEENPYHGNLLIHKDIDRPTKRNIQSTLATLATNSFIRRND